MDEFIARWGFVRSETLELLDTLTAEQLSFTPSGSDTWQPMYAHFGCIARTQAVYAAAIERGVMDFGLFQMLELPEKKQFADKSFAITHLDEINRLWCAMLVKDVAVMWPGQQEVSLANHVMRLAEHERLHHGQLISYFTLAGIDLPKNFKQNWAL